MAAEISGLCGQVDSILKEPGVSMSTANLSPRISMFGEMPKGNKTSYMVSRLGIQFSANNDYKLDMYGMDLPNDAPLAFCLGLYCEASSLALRAAGAKCVCLVRTDQTDSQTGSQTNIQTDESTDGGTSLTLAVRQATKYIFNLARESHSRGVYFIGLGTGAYFIVDLLSNKELLQECPGSYLLQAVYLLAGVYEQTASNNQENHAPKMSQINRQKSSPKTIKQKSFVEDMLSEHSSFEDRKNLSFICDWSNSTKNSYEDDCDGFQTSKKIQHGIVKSSKDAFFKSPIFKQNIQNKLNTERNNIFEDVLTSNKNEIITSAVNSLLKSDFSHLRRFGLRFYVFAGKKDGEILTRQSRQVYDKLSEGCDQENMHFEVKESLDKNSMRATLAEEDNFLRRLLRYDIIKHL